MTRLLNELIKSIRQNLPKNNILLSKHQNQSENRDQSKIIEKGKDYNL